MDNKVMTGKVKWFDVKKGFGFVTDENGNDVFIHFSSIKNGRHYIGLNDGDEITFTLKDGKKGPEAADAELVNNDRADKKRDNGGDRVVYSTATPTAE